MLWFICRWSLPTFNPAPLILAAPASSKARNRLIARLWDLQSVHNLLSYRGFSTYPEIHQEHPMNLISPVRAMLSILICTGLATLFFVTMAVGAPLAPQEPDAPGSISGQVTTVNGTPLPGLEVRLYRRVGETSWGFVDVAGTNESGTYRFSMLPPGRYVIQFADPNLYFASLFYEGAGLLREATEIPIAGNVVTGVNGVLPVGGVLAGVVTSTQPGVTSFRVQLLQERARVDFNGYPEGDWVEVRYLNVPLTATHYSFGGLREDTYRICATSYFGEDSPLQECYDNALRVDEANDITVTAGITRSGLDFVLGENPNDAEITGVVRSPAGEPLPGILVSAYTKPQVDWGPVRSDLTDATGGYRLPYLYPTTYTVRFQDPTGQYAFQYADAASDPTQARQFALSPGQTLSQVNVSLAPAARLTGSITILGQAGAPDVYVSAYLLVNDTPEWVASGSVLEETGRFTVTGLPAGTYRLCATAYPPAGRYEGCYGGLVVQEATNIELASGQTQGNLTFDLTGEFRYEGELSGTVTVEGTPVAGIQVNLHGGECCTSLETPLVGTQTDATGQYRFAGLRTGNYFVSFVDPAGLYASEIYSDQSSFLSSAVIVVSDTGKVDGINAELVRAGAISGTVQRRTGEPMAGLRVHVYPYDRLYTSTLFQTRTNEDGSFTVRGLPAGVYALCFGDEELSFLQECYGRAEFSGFYDFDSPAAVTVEAGQVTSNIIHIWGPDFTHYLPLIGR
jgi:5-hydroxyisourate hydrolase-like protein (transthyretin family)